MTKSPQVSCVIPALNAAPALGAGISGLRAALSDPAIIVVDDGSRDDTYSMAKRASALVIRFPLNRGKGAALRAGFEIALAHNADVIVTVDADGQHDPEVAPALVDATCAADLVIGARDRRGSSMPAGRRLTNYLSAAAVGRCIGQRVADAQSGYRAIRAEVVRSIEARGDRYEFETEFLVLAARRGYRIAFVPIPTRYNGSVPSQFRAVRDSARIIGTLWRFNTGMTH